MQERNFFKHKFIYKHGNSTWCELYSKLQKNTKQNSTKTTITVKIKKYETKKKLPKN